MSMSKYLNRVDMEADSMTLKKVQALADYTAHSQLVPYKSFMPMDMKEANDLARAHIAQAAELTRLRAQETKLSALLSRAREELYMIRMKDSGAVYDVMLRMELADALSAYQEAGK